MPSNLAVKADLCFRDEGEIWGERSLVIFGDKPMNNR